MASAARLRPPPSRGLSTPQPSGSGRFKAQTKRNNREWHPRQVESAIWLKVASAQHDGSAPSVFLGYLKAQAVLTHSRARPGHLGGSPWPPQLASAFSQDDDSSLPTLGISAPSTRRWRRRWRWPRPRPPLQWSTRPPPPPPPARTRARRRWRSQGRCDLGAISARSPSRRPERSCLPSPPSPARAFSADYHPFSAAAPSRCLSPPRRRAVSAPLSGS